MKCLMLLALISSSIWAAQVPASQMLASYTVSDAEYPNASAPTLAELELYESQVHAEAPEREQAEIAAEQTDCPEDQIAGSAEAEQCYNDVMQGAGESLFCSMGAGLLCSVIGFLVATKNRAKTAANGLRLGALIGACATVLYSVRSWNDANGSEARDVGKALAGASIMTLAAFI